MGIGLSFAYSTDITGSPTDGARIVVVGNPILPKFMHTFSQNFNPSAFAPPAVGTFGNAPKDVIRGPGINNWDISLFKKIPLPGERLKLQFRGEFYNAFNHTQFKSLDTSARSISKEARSIHASANSPALGRPAAFSSLFGSAFSL